MLALFATCLLIQATVAQEWNNDDDSAEDQVEPSESNNVEDDQASDNEEEGADGQEDEAEDGEQEQPLSRFARDLEYAESALVGAGAGAAGGYKAGAVSISIE